MRPQFKSTQSVDTFKAAVLPYLRAHAAQFSQLLIACERLTQDKVEQGPYLLAYLCEGGDLNAVCAVAVYSSAWAPRYLSLTDWPPAALPLLLDALAGHVVDQLVAPVAAAQFCSARLGLDHLCTHLVNYVLGAPPAAHTAHGEVRQHTSDSMPLLADWIVAFENECHFPARGLDVVKTMLEQGLPPLGNRHYDYWSVDQEFVAVAGMTMAGATARIGPVYTPPTHRGQGYAGALVAQVARAALENGAQQVCLYADAANATSNTLYQRIGFVRMGEFAEFGR
jgi:GNAT superfamily N-acetyltransferase